MSVKELEKPKIKDNDQDQDPDRVVHLRQYLDLDSALCGYTKKNNHRCGSLPYIYGEKVCPKCGKPICSVCLLLANTK